jgi:hypothetical protein
MSQQDDIQNALKPLGDLVHTLPLFSGYSGAQPGPDSVRYHIVLNTDDPESYRDRIESLLRDAGLADTPIELVRNPEFR